jgi:hypothetical protein
LILAKDSNADALLQVGEIGFEPAERYFTLLEGDPRNLKEVPELPTSPDAIVVRVKEARFTFQAKLINVENGEIVVSMEISQSTSRVSPAINIPNVNGQASRMEPIVVDTPQRRQAAVTQVMEAFNSHLSARRSQSRAKE